MPATDGNEAWLIRRLRCWLWVFIIGLALSGITAFPLLHEVQLLVRAAGWLGMPGWGPPLYSWLLKVRAGLEETAAHFPFLAYGTDWLAFAHLVIATAFLGPLKDPVRNRWVFTFGLIGCAGVVPLALIAGAARGIPIYWRMIDCSFGLFGCIPLLLCVGYAKRLEAMDVRFSHPS
jgi:hypothetical protein